MQKTGWRNTIITLLLILVAMPFFVTAQINQLSLKQAFELAEKNYPASRQTNLLQQSQELSIQNLNSSYLPQVSINAQATYQSEVTKVNVPIPGLTIPQISKDQYKAYADVSQLIYDGGLVSEQKKLQQLSTTVEQSKVNVELYNLKNRVFQLYFSILYQQELLDQTNLLLKDVQIGIDKVKPQVDNGVMLRSNLLLLQAQALQTQQRAIEIRNTKRGMTDALGKLLDTSFADNIVLQKMEINIEADTTIHRPEMELYNAQTELAKAQKDVIDARNLPRVSAFVQGGYGRPGLNMLSNNFDAYYIGGVRVNWALSNLYNTKRDKKLADITQRTAELQKETFVLNTQSQLGQQAAEVSKYKELIESDSSIIAIRRQVTDAAKAQLENAVITTNDYLKEINAEDLARQALIIHQVQLLQARVNYALTAGTF